MKNFKLKDENGRIYMGWYITLMGIILMTFAYSCVVSVAGQFMLPVTEDLGIQIGDFSLWMTILSLTAIVFLLFFSKIFSKKTVKKIMIIACICGVVGFVGFGTSSSLIQFYLSSVVLGICFAGLTTTPCTLLVSNWFGPAMRGKALGILFGGNSIAICIFIPILNLIIQTFGWRWAYFILAGILLVICLPMILKLTKWSPDDLGIRRMGDGVSEEVDAEKLEGISFKEGLKKPSTWIMFLTGTLLVIPSSAILAHSQPFMVMHGYSPTFASTVTSIMIGICLVTCIMVGAIKDKFGLRAAAIFTGIAFILAYVSQIYIPTGGMIMVLGFILFYGLGCPAVNIVSPLFANHMFGDKEVGAFIGYINMFISVGGAFGSSIVGKMYDASGSYITAFWMCAALLAIMTILRFILSGSKFSYKNRKGL